MAKRTPPKPTAPPPPPDKAFYLASVLTDNIDTTWRAVVLLTADEVEEFRDYLACLYDHDDNEIEDYSLEPVAAVAQTLAGAMAELGQHFTQATDEDEEDDDADEDEESYSHTVDDD